jgi:hypothetical protein
MMKMIMVCIGRKERSNGRSTISMHPFHHVIHYGNEVNGQTDCWNINNHDDDGDDDDDGI